MYSDQKTASYVCAFCGSSVPWREEAEFWVSPITFRHKPVQVIDGAMKLGHVEVMSAVDPHDARVLSQKYRQNSIADKLALWDDTTVAAFTGVTQLTFVCPFCGGEFTGESTQHFFTCSYCNNTFEDEQLVRPGGYRREFIMGVGAENVPTRAIPFVITMTQAQNAARMLAQQFPQEFANQDIERRIRTEMTAVYIPFSLADLSVKMAVRSERGDFEAYEEIVNWACPDTTLYDIHLLDRLDPEQREVATRLRGPLCVRAGAGTGKTRAITYRIAYGVRTGAYDPHSVMALTFTSRAAGELRGRLRDLQARGVAAHTFHAAALRQLSYFWPTAVGGKIPPIAEHKLSMVAQAAGQLGLRNDAVSIRDFASEIEWSRVSLIVAEDYPARAQAAGHTGVGGYPPEEIARLIRAYEGVKADRGVIDFEDVLLLLIGVLIDRPDVARTVRRQYRHFVVDEYQDVSPVQHRLLQLWLGDRRDLCVVGDVSQTIYSFAGASSAYLADFASEFSGAHTVELVRDYRSSPQIVACANDVIATDRSRGAVRLVSQLPSSVPVAFHEYASDAEEAEAIAREILDLRERGVPLGDMAILYRTNSQSAEFEAALSAAGIAFSLRGSERFFSRREVREAMVGMRSAARAGADGPLASDVKSVLRQVGWREQAPEQAGAARERWSALAALLRLAEDMEAARGASMAEFVAELEERAQIQDAPDVDSVTLASLHAAKGLEWQAVFLAGMSEGLVPISLAEGPEAVAEERRLMYVGMTRAKQHLHVSYAKGNGQRSTRKASRFLEGVWPKPDKPAVSRATGYRQRKAAQAEEFAREHPEDLPLFEALVEWRLQTARRIERPPYVVFHDTTLRSIAVAKPSSLSQLGRVRGVGATKLAEWGEAVLAVVREFAG